MQEQQQMQEASPAISQAQKKKNLQGGDPGNKTQEAKKL